MNEELDELDAIIQLKENKKTSSYSFLNKLKEIQVNKELNTGNLVDYLKKIASLEEASSYLKPYAEWLLNYFENLSKVREIVDTNINSLDSLDTEDLLNRIKNAEKDMIVSEKPAIDEESVKNSLAEIRKQKMLEKMNKMKEKFIKIIEKNSEEFKQLDNEYNDMIKIETLIQDFSSKEDDS